MKVGKDDIIREEIERMISRIDNKILKVRNRQATHLYLLSTFELVMDKSFHLSKLVYEKKMSLPESFSFIEGEFNRSSTIIFHLNSTVSEDKLTAVEYSIIDEINDYIKHNIIDLTENIVINE